MEAGPGQVSTPESRSPLLREPQKCVTPLEESGPLSRVLTSYDCTAAVPWKRTD